MNSIRSMVRLAVLAAVGVTSTVLVAASPIIVAPLPPTEPVPRSSASLLARSPIIVAPLPPTEPVPPSASLTKV